MEENEQTATETIMPREAAINEAFGLTAEAPAETQNEQKVEPPKTATQKTESTKESPENHEATIRRLTIENGKILRKLRELTEHTTRKDQTIAEFERVKKQLSDSGIDPAVQADALRSLGFDLNDYTDRALKTGTKAKSPEAIRIAELEKEMQERKRRDEEAQAAANNAKREADIRQQYDNLNKFVEANAEKYPALHAMGQGWMVVNEVHRRASAGELATTDTLESITAEMEAKLSGDIENSIGALAKSNLLDKYLKRDNGKGEELKKQLKSLSNDNQTTPKKPLDRSKLSEYERRRMAIEESFDVKLDE